LEPYLALPDEASLILLTSVLGASSNWLLLRYIYSILKNQDEGEDAGVVLVSFMRDSTFWREGAGRMVSLAAFQSLKDMC
jgi:elongator complex protein 6